MARRVRLKKVISADAENDPTLIRSPSPGKLVRFLVQNGDHVNSGDAIAEIEVMKMFMSIFSTEAGVFNTDKPAGVSLATGDTIGILTLDNPEKIKRAIQYTGSLPPYMYLYLT
jgi:acetyl-CoA carboxylase / biotin carboxylase 1